MNNPCLEIKQKYIELMTAYSVFKTECENSKKTRKTAVALKEGEKLDAVVEELKKYLDTPVFTMKNIQMVCNELNIDPSYPFQFRVSDENNLVVPAFPPLMSNALWAKAQSALATMEIVLCHRKNKVIGLCLPPLTGNAIDGRLVDTVADILNSPCCKLKRLKFESMNGEYDVLEAFLVSIVSSPRKIACLDFSDCRMTAHSMQAIIFALKKSGKNLKNILFGEISSSVRIEFLSFIRILPKLKLQEIIVKKIYNSEIKDALELATKKFGIKLIIQE